MDNLQKEFKNNDYAILNWKERNSVGKMVVKKTNFRSYEDIKNTLQAYENYAKAGNDASKEIEAIQKALKDIKAQYTKKEQVRQEAQQALDELKEQKRALRIRYYKADIFTQYPHQTLAIQSKENQRSEVELLKHIKESNYLESITQAKEVVEQIRKDIQRDFNITPIAEFGTNYAENYRDGANAIAKVLRERQGQVAGAFYKEELGDIDLVWGDSHFGLQHILERRTQDFIKEGLSEAEAKAKAREFVESIPQIIENGKIEIIDKRAFIYYDDKKGVIALDYKGDDSRKWLLTAYKNDEVSTTSADPHQSGFADKDFSTSSKSETKENSTTNTLNLQNISLQDLQTELKTFSKDEVLDLYEQSQKLDKSGEKKRNLLEAELKERIDSENIVREWVESEFKKYNDEYLDIPKSNGLKYNLVQHDLTSLYAIRDVLQKQEWHNKEQYQKLDTMLEDIIGVKRNNAKPLHLQSNPHIGAGLVSGSVAGVESDENGNTIGFNPSKFALGFLGGSAGSVALTKGFKVLKEKPELKEAVKRELADTLAKGFENASAKYPLLKSLEPVKHIMQSEKGRIAQAGYIIDKTFLEQSIKVLRDNVESMPKELSKEEFLTKGLKQVVNKERFLEHLQKAKDSKQRLAFLNLVEPTMAKANIELDILTDSGELRKGYLKAFEYGENRDLFYLLVTQDKDKLLISGYPISKEKEIKRILKKAKSITFKEGVAFEEITNRPELNKSSTLKTDSSIDSKLLSKRNESEVSL